MTDVGRSPDGSGCQPTASAAEEASSQSGIPNAVSSATATYAEMLPVPELTREQLLRFDSKFTEEDGGCWRWKGTRNHGRPYFKLNGRAYFAHRVMFAKTYGREHIDHALAIRLCGQADCVNPDHTALGDEVLLATIRKQHGAYRAWDGKRAGEANPNARFSDDEILGMFDAPGSLSEIATKFGASPGYVWRVKAGRSRASAIGAAEAGETPQSGSTEGESAVPERQTPNHSEIPNSSAPSGASYD